MKRWLSLLFAVAALGGTAAPALADIDWSCRSNSYSSTSTCEGSGFQYQNGRYVYYSLVNCEVDRYSYTCTGYADGQYFRVSGS